MSKELKKYFLVLDASSSPESAKFNGPYWSQDSAEREAERLAKAAHLGGRFDVLLVVSSFRTETTAARVEIPNE